jgi:hypothetical protein
VRTSAAVVLYLLDSGPEGGLVALPAELCQALHWEGGGEAAARQVAGQAGRWRGWRGRVDPAAAGHSRAGQRQASGLAPTASQSVSCRLLPIHWNSNVPKNLQQAGVREASKR